ncbi:MarR family transcriptional regulator [Amphritea sp. 1_MG-2023]|uniref:MarR family winged helix-turn-helix transcriptional regulator n=1 Tax=Amphritea sp. 1_MG-2023 TaxID=3062670 RepID=UPI0026E48E02|nr:MarR family transcriptional regulator [Amphritea sp. 1_MG-2023]MDO6563684.1 MarR family transcriptional regulator [Amphritea sp. 1_MG-2023]
MTDKIEETLLKPENLPCFSLYSAANAMVRSYRPVLDELDLTYPQYLAMLVLWNGDALNVKTLGEKLHMDSGTTTPLLKRMEAKGLVLRERCTQDERACIVRLTESGRALKQQAIKIPKVMSAKITISPEEGMALKDLCDKLHDGLVANAH